jgi:hypothetical protein
VDTVTDWTTMTRDLFDTDAGSTQLALDGMPVTDGCGTGDLLELIPLDGSLSDV